MKKPGLREAEVQKVLDIQSVLTSQMPLNIMVLDAVGFGNKVFHELHGASWD